MAKTGFPFYRAETDRFQDINIKRLKKRYHGNGYAVYQYILNEIYRVEGCFLDFGEDELFDVAEYWGLEEAEVQAIVTFCCEIGLFDMEMYDAYRILTSRSIQSRYTEMCKLSKRKATIPEKYLLLIPEETTTPEATATQNAPTNAPTSENTPTVGAKNAPTNQADIPVISPEISRKTPEILETSRKNGIFLEKMPKTPENFNRVEKSREEKEKNIPLPIPPEGKEEEIILSLQNQMQELKANQKATALGGGGAPESPRNTQGLLYQLEQYKLTPGETEEVLRLSNYGEIGGEVWKIIDHIRSNQKAIKTPRYFLLSRLRGACSA